MNKKAIITLFTVMLFCSVSSAQSWEKMSPLPSGIQSQNMYVYSSTTLFNSGGNGSLVRTTDKGITWQVSTVNNDGDIISGLYFTSDQVGYACGYHYCIHKTTDGGATWTMLERDASAPYGYMAVVFIDANTGFVAGDNGLIKKTVNAGQTWTTLSTGSTYGVNKLIHLGSNVLLTCGAGQNMLRSTNGGTTWNPVDGKILSGKSGISTPDNNKQYHICRYLIGQDTEIN